METSPWSKSFEAGVLFLRSLQSRNDHNFTVILGLASYVRDAVHGSDPVKAAERLATLRHRLCEAQQDGALAPIVVSAIEEMIVEVESAAARSANNDALEAVAAYFADAPMVHGEQGGHSTPAVDTIMQVGNIAQDRASAIWGALCRTLSPAKE